MLLTFGDTYELLKFLKRRSHILSLTNINGDGSVWPKRAGLKTTVLGPVAKTRKCLKEAQNSLTYHFAFVWSKVITKLKT